MNTGNSEKGFADELAFAENLAMRFLIDDPVKGWRVISAKRVLAAQRGELLMPELANRTVRIANAKVGMRSRKLVALFSVTLVEWRIDAEGRVDHEALMAGIIGKLDQKGCAPGKNVIETSLQLSQADLEAIYVALGLPRAK